MTVLTSDCTVFLLQPAMICHKMKCNAHEPLIMLENALNYNYHCIQISLSVARGNVS